MNSSLNPSGVSFAAQLKIERQQRGWAQSRVAELLGIETKTVYRWERGDFLPASSQREKLSTIFGRSLQELGLLEAPAPSFIFDAMIPLPPLYDLFGRTEQLAALRQRLRSGGNVALSALNGLPGVGKTALSIALARDAEVQEHFTGGILWAGLGPKPNILSHLARWATLLGLPASETNKLKTVEDWSLSVHQGIGNRTMLLVIDDVWTPEAALALKVGGSTCSHLITTRFPPLADQVASLGATVLRELSNDDGLALLQRLAPQIVQHDQAAARKLVEAVGGLPLALVLIGNYLRSQAYAGPARRIAAALQRLQDAKARLSLQEPRAPVERHPSQPHDESVTLESIIEVTDEQLSLEERNAFYSLSAFPSKPNSFSEEAALAVAKCSLDVLDRLIDTGLVQSGGADRYTLHQTIADYASLKLQGSDAQERLVKYMTEHVEAHSLDYGVLEIEHTNVLATLDIAFEHSHNNFVRLCIAFAPFLLTRSLYQLAETHLRRAYDAALQREDESGQIKVLYRLGQIIQRIGNFAEAEQYYQAGLMLARKNQASKDITMFLSSLGSLSWKQGKYPQADIYLQEGVVLAREDEDQTYLYSILLTLSSVMLRRGDFTAAEKFMREAIELYEASPSLEFEQAEMSLMLCNLGSAISGQGRYDEAEEAFREALDLALEINHSEWLSTIYNNLAELYKLRGDYANSATYFRRGLDLARQIGHREWTCVILVGCGEVGRRLEQFEQAKAFLQDGLQMAKELGIPQMAALALSELGQIALREGNSVQGEAYFQEMKPFVPENDRELTSWLQYDFALLAYTRGEIEKATHYIEQAQAHQTQASLQQITELFASLHQEA